MTTHDQEEQDLKIKVLTMELELKRKQAFWETPRNLVIIIGTITAAVATIAGVVGYKIGSQPQSIIVRMEQATPVPFTDLEKKQP